MSRSRKRRRGKARKKSPAVPGPAPGQVRETQPEPQSEQKRGWLRVAVPAVLVLGMLAVLILLRTAEPDTAPVERGIPDPDTSSMQPSVQRALSTRREAVEANPDSAKAWGHYGAVFDAHEMLAEAEECYRHALALAPGDFRWPFLLAYTIEMRGGDPEELVRLYRAAAAIEPGFLPVHYRLGQAYSRQGQLDRAREAFRGALAIHPDLAIVHRGLAQVLLMQGEVDAAVEHLEHAEATEPGNGEVLAALAQAYMRQGKSELARKTAERSQSATRGLSLPDPVRGFVKSQGMSSEICFERARTSLRAGRFGAAIADLKITLETRSEDAHVHELLGRAYHGDGQAGPAEQHYLRALELDPDLANAHAGLGIVYVAAQRLEHGIESLRRATELTPENGSFEIELAVALARAGRRDEALAAFERAERRVTLTPRAVRVRDELLAAGSR